MPKRATRLLDEHIVPTRKRNVTIRTNYPGQECSHQNMTETEISAYVNQCKNNLRDSFRWEFYPATYTHLVVCVRYEGTECNIYPQGYLMDDKEFETKIANRKDIKIESVLAYHRGTSKF